MNLTTVENAQNNWENLPSQFSEALVDIFKQWSTKKYSLSNRKTVKAFWLKETLKNNYPVIKIVAH